MTDPLTPAELDAIEARANAATPGPWNWYPHVGRRESSRYEMENLCGAPGHGEVLGINSETFSELETEEWIDGYPRDFDFISASRTDVPRLLAEVRRLREQSHMILSGLRWTGDGYEWTGAEFDYRIKPEESVAMMEQQRKALRSENERLRAENADLRQKLEFIATSHRGK